MTDKQGNYMPIRHEVVTIVSCNFQRVYQYRGKVVTKYLRRGDNKDMIGNNVSGVFE
jgi:hypothetical protein